MDDEGDEDFDEDVFDDVDGYGEDGDFDEAGYDGGEDDGR